MQSEEGNEEKKEEMERKDNDIKWQEKLAWFGSTAVFKFAV